jgi:hypothetical protein
MVLNLIAKNDDDDGWDTDSDKIATVSPYATNETRFNSADQPIVDQRQTIIKQQKENLDDDDLFIPIFTLVAICGLLGAYGYEMIRLYLRGELYLPFLH